MKKRVMYPTAAMCRFLGVSRSELRFNLHILYNRRSGCFAYQLCVRYAKTSAVPVSGLILGMNISITPSKLF